MVRLAAGITTGGETMTFNEYQQACLRTWRGDGSTMDQLKNCGLGLGEIGELQNVIKKHVYHGHNLSRDDIIDEAGDLCFYIAVTGHLVNADAKLFGRYDRDTGHNRVDMLLMIGKEVGFAQGYLSKKYYIEAEIAMSLRMIWCGISSLLYTMNIDIDEVMEHNIAKLKARYPDGFSEERSRNRDAVMTNGAA